MNIPDEVRTNRHIKFYGRKPLHAQSPYHYTEAYERVPTINDVAKVAHGEEIIVEPLYLGEWRDVTEEYATKHKEYMKELAADKINDALSAFAEESAEQNTRGVLDGYIGGYKKRR